MKTLKLPQFLKIVDELTASMDHKELEAFIHEIARVSPEGRRAYFLDTLRDYSVSQESDEKEAVFAKDDGQTETRKEVERVIDELKVINEGERCLDSEYNEEWDEWYNRDEDEILFSDPEKLLHTIRDAVSLIHQCIDMNLIDEGCRLAETLCNLEVTAKGDYNEYDGSPLGLEELYEFDLLKGSLENCIKECLYLTYLGNELKDRSEELYLLFDRFRYRSICLEDILQMGNRELPDFEEFLPLWIEELGQRQGVCAKKLLAEAQPMLGDDFALLENARKYVGTHPELYLQLLEMRRDLKEEVKLLDIGLEAMDAISPDLTIRSAIALKTAEFADRLCRFDVREKCWIEALRSKSTAPNYLRIKFLSRNPDQYRDQTLSMIKACYEKTQNCEKNFYRFKSETEERNHIYKNDYCAIMFFEEKYDAMEKTGMSLTKPLGWSATFLKEGIALMLLLLYQGNDYRAGMKSMTDWAIRACSFSSEILYQGTDEKSDMTDQALFLKFFEEWKDRVTVPLDLAEQWIQKIEKRIEQRTAGIMEANRRNYYGECASFIAALGEMKESAGHPGEKNRILLQYKEKYSRRRAFLGELRRYGMKG